MSAAYQPKTGARCSCKRGVTRDNCPACEGTGMMIDFVAIRARNASRETKPTARPSHCLRCGSVFLEFSHPDSRAVTFDKAREALRPFAEYAEARLEAGGSLPEDSFACVIQLGRRAVGITWTQLDASRAVLAEMDEED